MMKKIGTVLMAVVMAVAALALTGCNRQGDKEEIDVDKLPELVESEYAGTEIEFMHFWADCESLIPQLAEYFTEKTGIKVKVTLSPVASHLQNLTTRIQTDNVPALYTMWPGATMPAYVNDGWVADLTDVDADWNDRMNASARESCTIDGKLRIAPMNMAFMGIIYNKDIFADNGLTVPKNLSDFENIMKKILEDDPNVDFPLIWGSDCAPNYVYLLALSTLYQKYPDFDQRVTAGTMDFNCEEMQDIYKKLFIDWADAGYYNAETATALDRMSKAAVSFIKGNAAMMRVGGWDLAVLDDLMEDGGMSVNYGMFPMPGYDNDGSTLAATGEAIAMNAKLDENKRGAALEFLNYILAPYCNARICGNINSLSPYSGVEVKAADCIKEFQSYMDDTARGWNVWPIALQNKMGECFDIVLANGSAKKLETLQSHLSTLAGLWA